MWGEAGELLLSLCLLISFKDSALPSEAHTHLSFLWVPSLLAAMLLFCFTVSQAHCVSCYTAPGPRSSYIRSVNWSGTGLTSKPFIWLFLPFQLTLSQTQFPLSLFSINYSCAELGR